MLTPLLPRIGQPTAIQPESPEMKEWLALTSPLLSTAGEGVCPAPASYLPPICIHYLLQNLHRQSEVGNSYQPSIVGILPAAHSLRPLMPPLNSLGSSNLYPYLAASPGVAKGLSFAHLTSAASAPANRTPLQVFVQQAHRSAPLPLCPFPGLLLTLFSRQATPVSASLSFIRHAI